MFLTGEACSRNTVVFPCVRVCPCVIKKLVKKSTKPLPDIIRLIEQSTVCALPLQNIIVGVLMGT